MKVAWLDRSKMLLYLKQRGTDHIQYYYQHERGKEINFSN